MMNDITIIPFSKLYIDNYFEEEEVKNATGLVADIDLLLKEEQLEKFRNSYNGVISFLVFDPEIDKDILDYISSGALTRETDDEILILYCINGYQSDVKTINNNDFKILFKYQNNQSLEMVKFMFEKNKSITLPGLLVFDCVSNSEKSIYIQLATINNTAIIPLIRNINKIVKDVYNKHPLNFIDRLGVNLTVRNISYEKNINYSFGEYFVKIFKILQKLKSDIISIFA